MREYAKKPENRSRTQDGTPGASGQAPMEVILQRYKNEIQRYAVEDDEEPVQGKSDPVQREEIEEEELIQGKFRSVPATGEEPLQREEKPNRTGLPDHLKTGIENLSGYSMDDVKVHYNSDKPAQLHALAYAQGTDIHVAPGQEKHLPHEAWHVVQQKQGRVQPTMQMQGVNVNDNEGLEKEADVMGSHAFTDSEVHSNVIQCAFDDLGGGAQYTSQNTQGEDGSIYFRLGRIRLIHNEGPKIAVHPHRRRFIVGGNFNQFKHDYGQARINNLIGLNAFVQAGGDRWNIQYVNPNQPQPQADGRLFEVFLDANGNVTNSHKSRGGIHQLPAGLNNVDDQRRLYYVVFHAQRLAQLAVQNIDQNGILDNTVITKDVDNSLDGACMRNLFYPDNDTQAEWAALDQINNSINNAIGQPVIAQAIKTAGLNNPVRLRGFIGNSILRHSFDLAAAGLNVRANN